MDKKTAVPMTGDELFKTFFFFVAFIPYICLIYNGINGFVFAFRGAGQFYGFDAIFASLLLSPLIIFVPASIIYQIVYAVKHLPDHPALRIASLISVVCIIAGFIAVTPLSKAKIDFIASKDPDKISEYLSDKYGTNFVEGIKIHKTKNGTRTYNVTTDALKGKYMTVKNEINPKDDYVFSDDLIDIYADPQSPYLSAFSSYLDDEYDVPFNMDIKPEIRSIRFGDYKNGDDYSVLFERTDYDIGGIDVHVAEHTKDSVMDSIDQVYKDIYPYIKDKIDRLLVLYIEDNEYRVVYASIFDIDGEDPYVEIRDDWGSVFGEPVDEYRIDLK